MEKSADTVTNDDPRFKLSVETRVKLASKRNFKEDLEITRSSLTRLGYNLKKETKPNVTTEPLEKENVQVNFRPSVESVIDEAPSKENVVNIEPPKLESVAKVENLESKPSPGNLPHQCESSCHYYNLQWTQGNYYWYYDDSLEELPIQ